MLTYYFSPNSISLAAHIMLDEVQAAYQAIRVDFSENQQRAPEFLQVNPKGRVPALVTEHGILTETPAILTYLAQMFPAADPAMIGDPFAFARVQEFAAYLCATVHVAHAHKTRGRRWVDDDAALQAMQRKVPESMLSACRLIEDGLLIGPWVMGDHYTICDPYLYAISRWLEGDGVDVSRLPRLLEHRARMRARPAVQRLMTELYV